MFKFEKSYNVEKFILDNYEKANSSIIHVISLGRLCFYFDYGLFIIFDEALELRGIHS